MELSDRLSALRREKGLTLRELAEQVGITAAALSNYEKGQKEPSLSYAKKLAQYYGVSLDYLCSGEKNAKVQDNRFFTYGDIIRTLFALIAYTSGGCGTERMDEHSSRIMLQAIGKTWKMETRVEHPREMDVSFILKDTRITEFFDVYMRLKQLVRTKQLPQSVCDDWYKNNLKAMDGIKLETGESSKNKTPYLTAVSTPIPPALK